MAEQGAGHGTFGRFLAQVVLLHTGTYLIAGFLAANLADYPVWWQEPYMAHYRQLDDPRVALGPSLQVVRGAVFALVLWPLRAVILAPGGWRALWGVLVGVGIVGTYAAGPGSLEGLIYTKTPLVGHAFGLPEVLGQSLAFSVGLYTWHRRPHAAWWVVFGAIAAFALFAGIAGSLLGPAAGGLDQAP